MKVDRNRGWAPYPPVRMPEMPMRDWFAGQALAGILASPDRGGITAQHAASITEAAYGYADAMLAERERDR